MKVKDWIEVLRKANPNAEVLFHDWRGRSYFSPLAPAATQKIKRAYIVRTETVLTRDSISALLWALPKKKEAK